MLFPVAEKRKEKTIILLHGGGLGAWSWQHVAARLAPEYDIVTPTLGGHAGAARFAGIAAEAEELIAQIMRVYGGRVFCIGGLSLGAQIVVAALAKQTDIAGHAVIESALVCPRRWAAALCRPAYAACYGLIEKPWFTRLQAKALSLPEEMFAAYARDSRLLRKDDLLHIAQCNSMFALPPALARTQARALVIAGGRERRVVRRSARQLWRAMPGSRLFLAPGLRHGELSLRFPDRYAELLRRFFAAEAGALPGGGENFYEYE